MSEMDAKDTSEVIAEIEKRPDTDPARLIPFALRECADKLTVHMLIGSLEGHPFTWTRWIAMGNLPALDYPVYVAYPSPNSVADWTGMDRIKQRLGEERITRCYPEALTPLKATGIMTGALAMHGADKDGAEALVVCHHPQLTLGKAACLLLAACMHLEVPDSPAD